MINEREKIQIILPRIRIRIRIMTIYKMTIYVMRIMRILRIMRTIRII